MERPLLGRLPTRPHGVTYDIGPQGASARGHLLNGSTGVVIGFASTERDPDLMVDFDRKQSGIPVAGKLSLLASVAVVFWGLGNSWRRLLGHRSHH